MTAREMETEAAIYWRAARNMAALRLAFFAPKVKPEVKAQIIDDLEAVAMHSEWPRLRTAAANTLARWKGREIAV